jgi:hypothetical protein
MEVSRRGKILFSRGEVGGGGNNMAFGPEYRHFGSSRNIRIILKTDNILCMKSTCFPGCH